jgi:hypothetical protein
MTPSLALLLQENAQEINQRIVNIAFGFQMYPSTVYGRPVFARLRIALSVVAGVFFGFLLFEASVILQWFNIARCLYLVLGIANGFLIGFVEVRTVIRGVNEREKTVVWQPLLVSAVTFPVPLLVAVAVFGASEVLPFAGYVVLPFVPIYYAVTGGYYYKTEKLNNIRFCSLFTPSRIGRNPFLIIASFFPGLFLIW